MALTFSALTNAMKYIGTESRLTSNRAKNGFPSDYAQQMIPIQFRVGSISTTASETGSLVLDARTTRIIVHIQGASATTTPNSVRVSLNQTVDPISTTTGIPIQLSELPLDAVEAATDSIVGVGEFYVAQGSTVGIGVFGGSGAFTGTIRVEEFGLRQVVVGSLV